MILHYKNDARLRSTLAWQYFERGLRRILEREPTMLEWRQFCAKARGCVWLPNPSASAPASVD